MSSWTEEEFATHMAKLKAPPVGMEAAVTADVSEAFIEAECTRILQEDGWRPLRTDPVSDRGRGKGFGEVGMADHMYVRYTPFPRMSPDGHYMSASHTLWIEFKRGRGGVVSKAQRDWHAKERARGALTLIAGEDFPASVAGFQEWYRASGLQRHDTAAGRAPDEDFIPAADLEPSPRGGLRRKQTKGRT